MFGGDGLVNAGVISHGMAKHVRAVLKQPPTLPIEAKQPAVAIQNTQRKLIQAISNQTVEVNLMTTAA